MAYRREKLFAKINSAFILFYYLFLSALILLYIARRDAYHLGISVLALVMPPGIFLLYRLFRVKPVHQLTFAALLFTFIAYPLGSCAEFYTLLPGFDKLAHMLSGTFASLLCLILFCALRPGGRIPRGEIPLGMLFVFFGAMTSAGLWEIGEYIVSFIVGLDLQRAALTGVSDTMQDMIVCALGALCFLPCVPRFAMGRRGALTGIVEAFFAVNKSAEDPV